MNISHFFSSVNVFDIFFAEVPAEEIEPTIFAGDIVYFLDDETGDYGWGEFEGFYSDLHAQGETSPYWLEHVQGVHRLRIREILADGNLRPNYILPESVYALTEVEDHVFATEVAHGLQA